MAYQINWSPAAVDDVDAIASYIARDSAWYASSVVDKILTTTRSIPDFPHLGRKVPEIDDDAIRERIVYSYRIIYRLGVNEITIVAVIHGRQLVGPILAKRKEH